jgi:beta-lactamase class A
MIRHSVSLCAALAILAAGPTSAQTRREAMDRKVHSAIGAVQGTVCLFAKNLDTGETYGVREDEKVRTASTIKLPIMATVFQAVQAGRARWSDPVVLRDAEKVSGSGVLTELSDGVRLPLSDVMHLMIVVSDNTATNLVLDRFPADSVNDFLDKLGLRQTRALRKVLNGNVPRGISKAGKQEANKRFGLGVSTSREMVRLLEMLEKGEVVSTAASKEMLAILKRQQYKDGIGRRMPDAVASKSGALDRLRSDVGIVYSPRGRIAIAVTVDDMPKTDYTPENAGNVLIADLTALLVDGLGK